MKKDTLEFWGINKELAEQLAQEAKELGYETKIIEGNKGGSVDFRYPNAKELDFTLCEIGGFMTQEEFCSTHVYPVA